MTIPRLATAFHATLSDKTLLRPSFDEGGVRFEGGDEPSGYLPYDVITDVDVEEQKRLLRGTRVVLTVRGTRGDALTLPLEHGVDPLDAQRVWLTELGARRARIDVPALLLRGDRDLEAWLGALGAPAGGAYRGGSVEPGELLRVLGEPRADIDARAGAAFLLLGAADAELLEKALVLFLLHALPPLVVVAAATTSGGDALTDGETRARLARFLPAPDASALERLRGSIQRDAARAETLTAALHRARHRAEAELEAVQNVAVARRPLRAAGTHSAGIPSGASWVGRSWAL